MRLNNYFRWEIKIIGREREGEFGKEERERQNKFCLKKKLSLIYKDFRTFSFHFCLSFSKTLREKLWGRERAKERKGFERERERVAEQGEEEEARRKSFETLASLR